MGAAILNTFHHAHKILLRNQQREMCAHSQYHVRGDLRMLQSVPVWAGCSGRGACQAYLAPAHAIQSLYVKSPHTRKLSDGHSQQTADVSLNPLQCDSGTAS